MTDVERFLELKHEIEKGTVDREAINWLVEEYIPGLHYQLQQANSVIQNARRNTARQWQQEYDYIPYDETARCDDGR